MDEQSIKEKAQKHDQEHVLDWLDELEGEKRDNLLRQLSKVNFERVTEMGSLIGAEHEDIDFSSIEPAPVEKLPRNRREEEREEPIIQSGTEALEADRVACLTVAGGQGTRLKYDGPKGEFPITPVQGKSLFQVHAEKIRAVRRNFGCTLPWFIMTSTENHEPTQEFFEENDYFGLEPETVHFFPQKMQPILGESGELLRKGEDELLLGPGGHGRTFHALHDSGALQALEDGGWDLLSYFQVDNPLVPVADERFLGHHIEKNAEFSCKVIPKRDPEEGLGIVVEKDGHPAVIEYIEVPREIAEQTDSSGQLRFLYGSIAVHMIDVHFVRRMVDEDLHLPWHVAEKEYEVVKGHGDSRERSLETCYKFEQFIFEALPHADDCAFVEVAREHEFSPVKNAEGEDSPRTARRMMTELWADWLEQAGVDVRNAEGEVKYDLEISPLFARSAAELKQHLPRNWTPGDPIVLE
ncbi:MAG: UTP--glucose-1-phosphate uridylyltransferase [Planctomycetota bacterium]